MTKIVMALENKKAAEKAAASETFRTLTWQV
jgi:hypothetical protein